MKKGDLKKNTLFGRWGSFKNASKTLSFAMPYFWPKFQPKLRLRVIIAIALLAIGRIVLNLIL
jgi:hypothetical protein